MAGDSKLELGTAVARSSRAPRPLEVVLSDPADTPTPIASARLLQWGPHRCHCWLRAGAPYGNTCEPRGLVTRRVSAGPREGRRPVAPGGPGGPAPLALSIWERKARAAGIPPAPPRSLVRQVFFCSRSVKLQNSSSADMRKNIYSGWEIWGKRTNIK